MSSESDSEEFFDAFDITPKQIQDDSTDALELGKDSPDGTLHHKGPQVHDRNDVAVECSSIPHTLTSSHHPVSSARPVAVDSSGVFKVPLAPPPSSAGAVTSRSKPYHGTNRHDDIAYRNSGGAPADDRISAAEDSCSSLSGSLLGNLRDEDESTSSASAVARASAARHRRRQQQSLTTVCSPPHRQFSGECDEEEHLRSAEDTCQACMMQPFRVVEPDASSVYSTTSLTKLNKPSSNTHGTCSHSFTGDGVSSIPPSVTVSQHSHQQFTTVASKVFCPNNETPYTIRTTSIPADSTHLPAANSNSPPHHTTTDQPHPPLPLVSDHKHHSAQPSSTPAKIHSALDSSHITPVEAFKHKFESSTNVTNDDSDERSLSPILSSCLIASAEPDLVASTKTGSGGGLRSSLANPSISHDGSYPQSSSPILGSSSVPAVSNTPCLNTPYDEAPSSSNCDAHSTSITASKTTGYIAIPFSSQSLPASSQPPKPPISLARRHKSHPGLLHISLLEPTRGIDHVSNLVENLERNSSEVDNNMAMDDGLLSQLVADLGHTECSTQDDEGSTCAVDHPDITDCQTMPPPAPVAPPRKKRRKRHTTDEDNVSMSSSSTTLSSHASKHNLCSESLVPQCSPIIPHAGPQLRHPSEVTASQHISFPTASGHHLQATSITGISREPLQLSSGSLRVSSSQRESFSSVCIPSTSDESKHIIDVIPLSSGATTVSSLGSPSITTTSPHTPLQPHNIISSAVTQYVPKLLPPPPPKYPAEHPLLPYQPPVEAVSSRTSKAPHFNLSKITKRSSQMIRNSNRKLIGLSSLLSAPHKGSSLSINSSVDERTSVSDSISIGKRSLDIKAAIMGKFLVKDTGSKGSSATTTPVLDTTTNKKQQPHDDLSDQEILSQVSLLNLDTGVRMTLGDAAPITNPLSLHMMKLTNSSPGSGEEVPSDDNSSVASSGRDSEGDSPTVIAHSLKKKTVKMKKLLERGVGSAVQKAKNIAARSGEDKDVFADDAPAQITGTYVKIKTAHGHKGPHEWDDLMYVQELRAEHQQGPVWCAKFSLCGRLLATAGQDQLLRVWVIKQAFSFFLDIRTKYNPDIKVSPTPSEESLSSQGVPSEQGDTSADPLDPSDQGHSPFMPQPFCVYQGHTADLLDVAWSKNYFLLTSSMDKTVRLWHISRKECLCIFQHVDFVTAIAFHPKDDRYFISGSLDSKLRLWSIPEKRVMLWTEVEGSFITAANFCQNGAYTVVGTYDGRCLFYSTNQLKYNTQFNVRSARGKNSRGRKITGIEPLPGENKVLVTSNDSRIRLYGLDEHSEHCKYKGLSNMSSQIRASFSHDGKFIVAGSENQCIYLWKTHHDYGKFNATVRRDRNAYWEGVKAHSAVVTCALFSPHPELVFNFIEQQEQQHGSPHDSVSNSTSTPGSSATADSNIKLPLGKHDSLGNNKGYMLVSADFNGCIKVFLKREKPKHSSLPATAMA